MASPAAQLNIKACLQKTNKYLAHASTSGYIFQDVVVLRKTDVKLSRPSLQDVKELDCLNKKILDIGRKISYPQNYVIVDKVC